MLKMRAFDLNINVFKEFKENYGLIVAGGKKGSNLMTVSWGGMGVLWNKNVVFLFVRPQRYTMKFINENDKFTISFFDGNYKDNLIKAGRISGEGIDKFKETGFTKIYDVDNDINYVREATYVFKLKKLYVGDILKDKFIDKSLIEANYPNNDFHHIIIAEITNVLVNESKEL